MASFTSDGDNFYEAHFNELVEIATQEFGVPVEEAEQLAFDVCVAAIRHRSKMTEPRVWLVGAITCAARHYSDVSKAAN